MFANTRLFSPVVTEGITQAEPGSYEWVEWWQMQDKYCREGYTVAGTTITGIHYFYLNFWKIKAASDGARRKRNGPPMFLDMDYEFFWEWEHAKAEGKDLLVLKCRQRGFSFKDSCIAGHELTFQPESHTIITAGKQKYTDNNWMMFRLGLDGLVGTPFSKRLTPNRSDFVMAAYAETMDGITRMHGYKSVVERIVSTAPQSMIGRTPSTVIYEEVGDFKGFLAVKEYIEPGMEVNGRRTGTNLLIGTGGEADPNEETSQDSIDELTDAFYYPEKYNLRSYRNIWDDAEGQGFDGPNRAKCAYFVPATKFFLIDKDGNSLIEESKAEIMKRRAAKEGNDRTWLIEVTQRPLTPQEALLVPSGNRFNVMKLRQRKATILRHSQLREKIQRGDLEWVKDVQGNITGVDWKLNPVSGRYRIGEHPVIDEVTKKIPKYLYVGSTDSYDRDQAVDPRKGSFGSCYVRKRFNTVSDTSYNKFVASLTERPATSDEFYEDTAKLMVYYGWAENLIEYSNLGIFRWYGTNGFNRLLRIRPEIAYANVINSKMQNKVGVDPQTKPHWIQMLADDIEINVDHYDDLNDLEALINYRDEKGYNCDRTVAMALGVVHDKDLIHVAAKPVVDEKWHWRSFVSEGGRILASYQTH